MQTKRTVLITGCSAGGLGDSLAQEFHKRGLQVIATGRNPSKLAHFHTLGISTQILDVLSPDSIAACISAVTLETDGTLDMLINNSGANYSVPLADASIPEARKLFDLNVWSALAVTQAFLPLLLKSTHGGMIVNNTSIASVTPNPTSGIYNMSKAAAAMMTDTMRLELAPFGLKVVDLKTGAVRSNFYPNQVCLGLPEGSIYMPAREAVERSMRGEELLKTVMGRERWAELVVKDLLAENPPIRVWRGTSAFAVWFARRFLPFTFMDREMRRLGGLDIVREKVVAANKIQ